MGKDATGVGTDAVAAPAVPVPPPRRRRRGRIGLWLLLSLVLVAVAGAVALLGITGQTLKLPEWVIARMEARGDRAFAGQASLDIGGGEILVDSDFVPQVRLSGVQVRAGSGAPVALLPELRVTLLPEGLMEGRIAPGTLRVSGAQIVLARGADGQFDLSFGSGTTQPATPAGAAPHGSALAVLDAIDAAFDLPALERLDRIDADGLTILYDDRRAGQRWEISNGRIALRKTEADLSISVSLELAGNGGAPGAVDLSFVSERHSHAARFGATVRNLSAESLSGQTPALAWLSVLDAPISGSFRTATDDGVNIGRLDGTLEIGAGAVQPVEAARPVAFDGAKLYFGYDPAGGRIEFSDMAVSSAALRMHGSATAWLQGQEAGLPRGIVAQVALSDLQSDPQGLFANPVSFSRGAIDLKLDFDPFRLTIGQFMLGDADGHRIVAKGTALTSAEGWHVGADLAVAEITLDRLLSLWPLALVPRTREWITTNVATGELFGVKAAVRIEPKQEPRLSLNYEFRGADVRVLRTLPPVTDGAGYSTIDDKVYTMVVQQGHITAPNGAEIGVAGSVMTVPNIDEKPAAAHFTLRTDSSITGALSLLNEPPFELMKKAGREIDIAEGRATAVTEIDLRLVKQLKLDQVAYRVAADLTDVRSAKLVPGRTVEADALTLAADNGGVAISGPGRIDDVPFRMTWRQGFGPGKRGHSDLEGSVEISPKALDTFGIRLPPGMVGGAGQGDLTIALRDGKPPALRLTSDLNRIALDLSAVGWTKPAATRGKLEVEATLSRPVEVTRLALSAPGLSAEGKVALKPDATLDAVSFSRVTAGQWFDGPLEIQGRGPGKPVAIAVTGGTADLRKANFGSGGAGGENVPLTLALDRLTVSQGIALTGFQGRFNTAPGLSGDFTAKVNGAAAVTGAVVPARGGGRSAVRIRSSDAGAAFRAAGIFKRARGGVMDLILNPVGAEKGTYDGTLAISDFRVSDAPVLAALLGAISVIGLLEQLNGDGLVFTAVDGRFRLTPDRLEIGESSAVGPSLGVSMSGVYGLKSDRIELQGVVSPVYLVNALGQVVSKQKGEGLFGFNYRISGSAANPAVTVNPLSILTPGMFREIFRRAPPEVKQ